MEGRERGRMERGGKMEGRKNVLHIYISGMQITITLTNSHLQIQPTTDRIYSQNVPLLNKYRLFPRGLERWFSN